MKPLPRRSILLGALATASFAACSSSESSGASSIGPLLAPALLASRLDDIKSGKIAVLYIGPDMLFSRGHVPGARKIGEASTTDGRRLLNAALADISKDTEIVVYCGCCAVRDCPNIRPASAALRALGHPNAHVLDLPSRFATDWAEKGYAVERG